MADYQTSIIEVQDACDELKKNNHKFTSEDVYDLVKSNNPSNPHTLDSVDKLLNSSTESIVGIKRVKPGVWC